MTPVARNLPDEFAQELIRRNGLIGLNFFAIFIGLDHEWLFKHMEHGLKLGGENALAFGADFFCDADYPDLAQKYRAKTFYFDEMANSSRYPILLNKAQEKLQLADAQIGKLSHENVQKFIARS